MKTVQSYERKNYKSATLKLSRKEWDLFEKIKERQGLGIVSYLRKKLEEDLQKMEGFN